MRILRSSVWAVAVIGTFAMLPGAAMAAGSSAAKSSTGTYAVGKALCPAPKPGQFECMAMKKVLVKKGTKGALKVKAGGGAYGAPAHKTATNASAAGANATVGPAGGLTPSDFASAYGYNPATAATQTVAVVDAYDDPTIQSDLDTFDTYYGLPACDAGCLTKVNQTGAASPLPARNTGWAGEIALDVETVHSVCETCKIILVEAKSSSSADLDAAENEAAALGANEITNSFGGQYAPSSTDTAAFNHSGVVITASAGDDGLYNFDQVPIAAAAPNGTANFPASGSTVVAVGGTTLNLGQNAKRQSETVWNDNGTRDYNEQVIGAALGAGGGGCAPGVGAKRWQQALSVWYSTGCGAARLASDVSADADYLTGFDTYDTTGGSGWGTIGGTSLASPLIAGQFALDGGSHGIPYPAVTLYGHLGTSSLYDVTSGGNGYCDGVGAASCTVNGTTENPNAYFGGPVDCAFTNSGSGSNTGDRACDALPGYDGATGVGTPNNLAAFAAVRPTATINPPAGGIVHGTAETWSATASDPLPGGSVTSYHWSWGDGTKTVTASASTTHTYSAAGTRTVLLQVVDNYGVGSFVTTYSATVS